MQNKKRGKIIIPAGRKLWPHELRVAEVLAGAGYSVEFICESYSKTADILLDGSEFEIKSPRSFNANSLEHLLKKASRQAPNIVIDTVRLRSVRDEKVRRFLCNQFKKKSSIKRLLMISKQGVIIDIESLV